MSNPPDGLRVYFAIGSIDVGKLLTIILQRQHQDDCTAFYDLETLCNALRDDPPPDLIGIMHNYIRVAPGENYAYITDLEVCAKIRELPETADIPIMISSVYAHERATLQEVGADASSPAPLHPQALTELRHRALRARGRFADPDMTGA